MRQRTGPAILTIRDRNCNMQEWDPFLRPDWRFERVLEMTGQVPLPGRTTRRDDDTVREVRSFMLKWNNGSEAERRELRYRNPGFYYAFEVYRKAPKEPELQQVIEARLLTGQPCNDIAFATKTKSNAVEWYEAVFFNVSDKLVHDDWIFKHVLLPASDRLAVELAEAKDDDAKRALFSAPIIRPHLDFTLKFFAYFGGLVLCNFMMTGFRKGVVCHTQDEIGQWLDHHWEHQMRRRSAQAAGVFDVNRYNVMELFQAHSKIIEVQTSQDSIQDKQNESMRIIGTVLNELPWRAGKTAKQSYTTLKMEVFSTSSAELRDDELLHVQAGEMPFELEKLPELVMPLGPGEKE